MGEAKLQRFTKVYPLKTCNFKKQCVPNLIYDEIIDNGLIIQELYYSDEEKTDLVVSVDVNYFYGVDTLIRKIEYVIHYHDEDNESISFTHTKKKILTGRQKIKLLKKRRKTIREGAEASCLGLMQLVLTDLSVSEILSLGAAFLLKHDVAFDHYEKVGSPQILQDLSISDEYWLDEKPVVLQGATIRQFLLNEFSS